MGYSGAGGKLIDEKNQKRKISWHCPFKRSQTNHYLSLTYLSWLDTTGVVQLNVDAVLGVAGRRQAARRRLQARRRLKGGAQRQVVATAAAALLAPRGRRRRCVSGQDFGVDRIAAECFGEQAAAAAAGWRGDGGRGGGGGEGAGDRGHRPTRQPWEKESGFQTRLIRMYTDSPPPYCTVKKSNMGG